ncbi:MAG TPA: hypothetical protein VEV37_07875 [Bryobacteraceae bacterium]|nr:hypothetical protein [Bryobacteraceae bacterium]
MKAARLVRVTAGVLVLAALTLVGAVLIRPYAANWKLQRYLNDLTDDPATAGQPPESTRSKIVEKASALGLPLSREGVQVTPSQNALRIDALYVVHVDIAGYTVDLHFRPAAGGS